MKFKDLIPGDPLYFVSAYIRCGEFYAFTLPYLGIDESYDNNDAMTRIKVRAKDGIIHHLYVRPNNTSAYVAGMTYFGTDIKAAAAEIMKELQNANVRTIELAKKRHSSCSKLSSIKQNFHKAIALFLLEKMTL